jgi:hypothetical protein
MKALIDGDIFQWEFGTATDKEYKPLAWPLVQSRIDARIQSIIEATKADSYQIYLTTDDKSNFRFKIASIKPYKGHRATEKPYWYTHVRNFLVDCRGAQEVSGQEADDAMSIAQMDKGLEETVICSRDKDLNMVPGWHYTWPCGDQKEKPLWLQSEIGGLKCFYTQMILGDPVDNILGLYGLGPKCSYIQKINKAKTELEMHNIVYEQYEKRFGNYAEKFYTETGRLLWMRRHENEIWRPTI